MPHWGTLNLTQEILLEKHWKHCFDCMKHITTSFCLIYLFFFFFSLFLQVLDELFIPCVYSGSEKGFRPKSEIGVKTGGGVVGAMSFHVLVIHQDCAFACIWLALTDLLHSNERNSALCCSVGKDHTAQDCLSALYCRAKGNSIIVSSCWETMHS